MKTAINSSFIVSILLHSLIVSLGWYAAELFLYRANARFDAISAVVSIVIGTYLAVKGDRR